MCDEHNDKPFVCSAGNCGMRFTNEDHLNVHMKKHEMSLAVNPGGHSNYPGLHVLDQTPTPTKFLKNCEEIGLFQELSKNPFEEAFKQASDADGVPPIPGPHSGELNTPVLPAFGDKASGAFVLHEADKAVQSPTSSTATRHKQNPAILPGESFVMDLSGQRLREKMMMVPSSTTLEQEEASVISVADSTQSPSKPLPSASLTASVTEGALTHTVASSQSGAGGAEELLMRSSMAIAPHSAVPQQQQEFLGSSQHQPQPSFTSPPQDQQPHTMQVYLQLPTGQTLPVHIPAVNTVMPDLPSDQAQQAGGMAGIAGTHTQSLQHSASGVSPTAATSPSAALKQRLKLSLQAQHQPGVVTSSSVVKTEMGEELLGVQSQVSTPTTSLHSPSSTDFNLSDLEPVIKRPKNGTIDTDDPVERRQKFLERNRAAAARCRHKRKQWIVNLEKKADELQQTNSKLQSEVGLLRGEVAQLKTLLLAHHNCPITVQQQSDGQSALQTIAIVESAANMSFDLTQLSSTGPGTSVDSQDDDLESTSE